MDYSPKKMQEILEKNNFNLKKKFGQNFIVDENIITSIINKAEIDKDTLVIEIGPGAGSLTYKLAQSAKNVLCYEIDTSLENVLLETLKEFNNVEIIFKDFLAANVKEDLKEYDLITIEEVLKKYNLDLSVRAEALPIEIFIDIANNISK